MFFHGVCCVNSLRPGRWWLHFFFFAILTCFQNLVCSQDSVRISQLSALMPTAKPSPDLLARRAVVSSSEEGEGCFWSNGGWESGSGERPARPLLLGPWRSFSHLSFRSDQQNCTEATALSLASGKAQLGHGWIQVLRQCSRAHSPPLNSVSLLAALCDAKGATTSSHLTFCHPAVGISWLP